MKILVITDLFPVKESEKYTPRTIKVFTDEWIKRGNEVRVIKPNFIFNSILRRKPFYRSGLYGNIENINYFTPFLGDIRRKIKSELDSDIVLAHMPSGIIFANRLGLKFCAAVHSSDIEVLTNPVYSIYFKRELELGYRNAAGIFCRSEALKRRFLELYPELSKKTQTAPSGVDEGIIFRRNWQKRDKVRVLTCGQFIKRKNIDKVIRACEGISEVELTVIGDGRERKNLEKISEKPRFTGWLGHDEVLKYMRESDIFVLPSVGESFGMVYLESMASGCVTICTENDGIDGIIKDGINGYTTAPEGVSDTLKRVISRDNGEIVENAYRTIGDYSAGAVSESYLNAMIQALSNVIAET